MKNIGIQDNCSNTPGSYQCTCHPTYKLQSNLIESLSGSSGCDVSIEKVYKGLLGYLREKLEGYGIFGGNLCGRGCLDTGK